MNLKVEEAMNLLAFTGNIEGCRKYIGGSDARIIMAGDEAGLIQLWKEKRGEAEPEGHLALVAPRKNVIPGRSVSVPVNSTPADSKTAFSSIKVDVRLAGIPSTASNLLIVRTPTPDFSANSAIDQRRAARAERI